MKGCIFCIRNKVKHTDEGLGQCAPLTCLTSRCAYTAYYHKREQFREDSCFLLCLQMAQGLLHGGSTPAFLHTTNVPQQSTVGYIQQQQLPQAQQQQRQYQHSQNQTGSVTDFRNLLTR